MIVKIIIFLSLAICTSYLLVWVSLKELLPLFEIEYTTFWVLFPFLFFLILGMLLYLSKKINEVLYCYTYILVFIIFGYTINSFTCCLCTILIKLFTKDLPFLLESIFNYLLSFNIINIWNKQCQKYNSRKSNSSLPKIKRK